MVPGINKIKTLRCTVTKKEIVKGRDGEFLVNNCGPVLFKKRTRQQKDLSSLQDETEEESHLGNETPSDCPPDEV